MKINILRGIIIILLIGTFFIIFKFSGQSGEESSSISKKITEVITKNIKYIQNLEKEEKEKKLAKIEQIIRKLAHFSLYTVVGILLMSLVNTYKLTNRNRIIISFIAGFLYAVSDEIHQTFIPARSGEVRDVIIDTCGVITGIIIVFFILKLVNYYKNSKSLNFLHDIFKKC